METSRFEPSRCSALQPLLAFGAHPDDIEFGCGGIIAKETRTGRAAHFVICSRGEAASHGTPARRVAEAKKSAALLGATVEFIELDGDAHLEVRVVHAIKLAGILRRVRPGIVLAPSLVENQHPDHAKLGQLVRDAARLARYGGIKELRRQPPHSIDQLFFYAVTPEANRPASPPCSWTFPPPEFWRHGQQRWKRTSHRFPPAATLNYSLPARGCAGCARASAMPSPCFPMTRPFSIRLRSGPECA